MTVCAVFVFLRLLASIVVDLRTPLERFMYLCMQTKICVFFLFFVWKLLEPFYNCHNLIIVIPWYNKYVSVKVSKARSPSFRARESPSTAFVTPFALHSQHDTLSLS